MNSSSDPAAPAADPAPDATPIGATPDESGAGALMLRLDGFEGPLDLLLDLARAQKVDLARISILALVQQYLAVIEGARQVRLELAADWLVMAAWLTWLKSRLLLPADSAAAEEAEEAAEVLAARLRDLMAIRAAARWLGDRPALGRDVFARGAPEDHTEIDRSGLALSLPALLRAYLGALRRGGGKQRYRPRPLTVWTVQDALARLRILLGSLPDGASLEQFLPDFAATPTERKAALASTLLAGLELARDGAVELQQDRPFGPLRLRPTVPAAAPA
ncbi:MAG: segregation/condensation protein A [Rhodospirillales bacterium]|jgi:segregation and condensation protein A|nr:segregation/condensation protein A [Rhodospirillales bacterium]